MYDILWIQYVFSIVDIDSISSHRADQYLITTAEASTC